MSVRTISFTIAALACVSFAPALAQQPSEPSVMEVPVPTITAQVQPLPAEIASATDVSTPRRATTRNARCRWESPNRQGLEFLLIPLDVLREGLSTLRRGTVRSCPNNS